MHHKTFGNIFYIVIMEENMSTLGYWGSDHLKNLVRKFSLSSQPFWSCQIERQLEMKWCIYQCIGHPTLSGRRSKAPNCKDVWGSPVNFICQWRVDCHLHIRSTIHWPQLESNYFKAILLLRHCCHKVQVSSEKWLCRSEVFLVYQFLLDFSRIKFQHFQQQLNGRSNNSLDSSLQWSYISSEIKDFPPGIWMTLCPMQHY